MNSRIAAVAAVLLGSLALIGCKSGEKDAQKPLTAQDTVEAKVTAKVKAVNHDTRIITLQDTKGNSETFRVDERVRRLNEVAPGDDVTTTYKATMLAELRAPTAAEAQRPISIIEVEGRSPQGSAPAAGAVQAVRIVTTVEAVDVPNKRVTLRGPLGDLFVVPGKKTENLKKLKVGDTIVITLAESLVIELEKLTPR